MTDAPSRIWVHVLPIGPLNSKVVLSDEQESSGQVEYVRADTITALREELREAREVMAEYLPILERAEEFADWSKLAAGTGIATANRYRAFLAKTKPEGAAE